MMFRASVLRSLPRPFWVFFSVCFFFDFGFSLYFFLINLYLDQLHFTPRAIGIVSSALTLGNVAATLPIGFLARRYGLRPFLFACLIAAPCVAAARGFAVHTPLQIALAFLQGVAMCGYTVCFPPALARLTSEENRTLAFTVTFATGIASGAIAGIVGGFLPGHLQHLASHTALATQMRTVLLLASAVVVLGAAPLTRLRFPAQADDTSTAVHLRLANPFLLWFLMSFAVWNLAIGAFAPFANIYFAGPLHLPLERIGLIFSTSQALQVTGVLAAPLLYRRLGKERGIACAQFAAAAALLLLGRAHWLPLAIALYLALTAFQYACSPGIYSLVMDRTPDSMRSSASALQNIVSCVALAASAALAGIIIQRFGYRYLLASAALSAAISALMLLQIARRHSQRASRTALCNSDPVATP